MVDKLNSNLNKQEKDIRVFSKKNQNEMDNLLKENSPSQNGVEFVPNDILTPQNTPSLEEQKNALDEDALRIQEEEARNLQEQQQYEQARQLQEQQQKEEAEKLEAEIARKAQEARIEEQARKVEEARIEEEARKVEETRKIEEARKEEQARKIEEARKEENVVGIAQENIQQENIQQEMDDLKPKPINPTPSSLLDNFDGTVKYDGVSNYGKEDLLFRRDFPETIGANVQELIPREYSYSDIPQLYHQMVDDTLTGVTTARYQHSLEKQLLWNKSEYHIDEDGKTYENIHYKVGNSNEEYDPVHVKLYENWPTSVTIQQLVPSQVEIDELIEKTENPIKSRQFSNNYQHSVLPNEVRFKQTSSQVTIRNAMLKQHHKKKRLTNKSKKF